MEYNDFSKGKPWAIHPAYLENMLLQIPDLKTAGEQAIRFTENPEERDDFMLRNGVAIIPITGPISKRGSFWSIFYGGTPLTVLTEVFTEALADRDVQAIVLDIDSPGGTVSGTEAFGDLVYNSRGRKPVVAFGNGMMTSAAYWIGSGADKIIVEQTTDVGSIGVVMVHWDLSEMDKMDGIRRTVMSAGKYKAMGNSAEPLSDAARKVFQAELDYVYTLFVDTVARNRGSEPETVLKDMADGRIFIGQQAVDVGLADSIGSMDSAIDTALSMIPDGADNLYYFNLNKEGSTMKIETLEQLKEAYPELYEQLKKQGAAEVNIDEAVENAVKDEVDRILGLAEIQFGEDEGAKFKDVVNAGVTVDQFAAIRKTQPASVNKETTDATAQMLEAIHNAGAENVGAGAVQTTGKDFMAQVEECVALHKCSKTEAIKTVMKKDPAAHKQYLESVN